ncbi:hypothetical protein SALBM217S_08525 [Streptomyces griseoloalbus]
MHRQTAVALCPRVHQDGVARLVGVVEVADEPLAVPVRRPLDVTGVRAVVAVDRPVHRGLPAALEPGQLVRRLVLLVGRDAVRVAREVRGAAGRVPDVVAGHRRQVDQAVVVRRLVLRVVAVVPAERLGRVGQVAVPVGLLVAHAVRPAAVGRLGDDGERVVLGRAPGRRRGVGVGADPARVEDVGLLVHGDARGVAHAHHVDLAAGLAAALVGLLAGEQVALGEGVAVRLGVDAQDLAVEVVGVAGGAARVGEGHALVVGLRVVARVTVAEAAGVVVTGGDVQVALGVPGHPAARVAAAGGSAPATSAAPSRWPGPACWWRGRA